MKETLERLFRHHTLSREEARSLMRDVASGAYPDGQVAALLTAYRMRPVTVDELLGFREALLDLSEPIGFDGRDVVDLCGTGGDGKGTINVSTLSAFVVAGAGVPVAKHGNYGVSSGCGSSNLLEALGITFTNDRDALLRSLESAGICFLHAPLHHPAMKNVAPVRKQLGVKTVFNLLGPLANPARPSAQLSGVYSYELLRLYAHAFQRIEAKFAVVYSRDGYDEISLTGPFHVALTSGEQQWTPVELGLEPVKPEELIGADSLERSAAAARKLLAGEGSPAQERVVLANAAMALFAARGTEEFSPAAFRERYAEAQESLSSGRALNVLTRVVELDG